MIEIKLAISATGQPDNRKPMPFQQRIFYVFIRRLTKYRIHHFEPIPHEFNTRPKKKEEEET